MSLDYRQGSELPLERMPFFSLVLIGADLTVFLLLILVTFLPEYFFLTNAVFSPLNSILPLILIIPMGGAFYHYLQHRYCLPLFLSALIPLLVIAGVLWPELTPLARIKEINTEQGIKLFIIIMGWICSALLTSALYRISAVPAIKEKKKERRWDESGVKFDLRPWQSRWRLFYGELLALITVGTLLVNHTSLSSDPLLTLSAQILFGVFLLIELLLLVQGNFYYQKVQWHVDGLRPAPGMESLWQKWAFGLIIVVFVLSMLLPGDLSEISKWWIIRVITGLFQVVRTIEPLPKYLSKSSELGETIDFQEAPTASALSGALLYLFQFLAITFALFIILALVLALVLLIGYLLNKFVSAEGKRLKGFPVLIRQFYLSWVRAFKRWKWKWKIPEFAGGKSTTSVDTGKDGYSLKQEVARILREKGPRAIVRRGYSRLISRGRNTGLQWRANHTPAETAVELTKLLPEEEASIQKITLDYQQARYARKEPGKKQARAFLQRLKTVMSRLRLSR